MTVTQMIGRVLRLLGVAAVVAVGVMAILWVPNRPPRDMRGLWETDGYGLVLDISATWIDILEVTPSSCRRWQGFPGHLGLARRFAGYGFSTRDDTLIVDVADIIDDVTAHPLATLPDACSQSREVTAPQIFDIFWETFAIHYPFFDLYDVDWPARRKRALESIGDSRDDKVLEAALRDAVRGIEDDHVVLVTPAGDYHPAPDPDWVRETRTFFAVPQTYLVGEPMRETGTGVLHGWLGDDIAYISIAHMEAEPPLGRQMSDRADEAAAQLAASYGDARGIVLDLRYNAGGSDTVALAYASAFFDAQTRIGRKATQTGQGALTPWTPIVVEGRSDALTMPVAILTSGATVSSAEIMVMALAQRRDVTLMGETTAGSLSDMLARTLPNGWQFTLSHQIYETADGVRPEGQGFVPDVAIPMDTEALESGRDPLLEAAKATLAP